MSVPETKDLHRRYTLGELSVSALAGVDFVVQEGEFVAIMGPSGSGKSTLLHLIGGLDKPSDGEVTLAGQRLSLLKEKQSTLLRRRNVGFVFQFFNLLPTLTAEENILLPVIIDGKNPAKYQDRLKDLLDLVGLLERALAERIRVELIRTEGFVTYGGLAGRDLEAMAQGLHEVLDEGYLEYRFAENAFRIFRDEKEHAGPTLEATARAMFDLAQVFTMSAKKDAIVNIGGLLCLNDDALFQNVKNELILREGFPTYGGLAGRELDAMAVGLYEGLDEAYLASRLSQTAYLAGRLNDAGIPTILPAGGHAVYLDAAHVFPNIPQGDFPGQALAVELYREG